MQYFHTKMLFQCAFYLLYPWVAKFKDLTTVGANDVIMLFSSVALFVLSHILAKLVFSDEVTGYQEVYRIVQRSATNPIILLLHFVVERFNIKMFINRIYFIEYSKTFWRSAVTILLQKGRKDLSY